MRGRYITVFCLSLSISCDTVDFQRERSMKLQIDQHSLVDLAVAEIQRLIYVGEIAPGENLREERLSNLLGISRPPLREALRVLAHKGIVEQLPRRGARVVKLTAKEVDEIYSLRQALERFALENAFPNPDAQSLIDMNSALEAMTKAAEQSDHSAIVRANRDFHVALVDLGRHERLTKTYVELMDQMQLCMSDNLRTETRTVGDYMAGVKRHRVLFEAIENGNEDDALEALANHGERATLSEIYSDH